MLLTKIFSILITFIICFFCYYVTKCLNTQHILFLNNKTRFILFALLIRVFFFCHSTKILNKHQILMYSIFKHKKERIRRAKAIRNLTLMIRALDSLPRLPRFKTTGWLQGRLYISFFRGQSN